MRKCLSSGISVYFFNVLMMKVRRLWVFSYVKVNDCMLVLLEH